MYVSVEAIQRLYHRAQSSSLIDELVSSCMSSVSLSDEGGAVCIL